MGSTINLPAIFIANGMGIMLSVSLLMGNKWKTKRQEKEYKYIRALLIISIISCMIDPLICVLDGKSGTIAYCIVYWGNFWFYLTNMLVGPLWIIIISSHLLGRVPQIQKTIITVFCVTGIVMLIVNLFYPVVFYVDESNVYQRSALYWLYTFIQTVVVVDGIIVYFVVKSKGGILKFFPVLQFIVPLAIGIVVQTMFYGVSTVFPCLTISICGMFIGLQNENVYIDPLTGTYNRFFMDALRQDMIKKKTVNIYAMMLDLNAFKAINDRFGHCEGDAALIKVAEILRSTVGSLGCVIRYAGDEFVILLNTQKESVAQECVESIRKKVDDYNQVSNKEYKLSLSIGCSSLDIKNQTIDDLISNTDKEMYLDKQKFYKENPDYNRREH